MNKSKIFNLAFPVWFLLLYPMKYLLLIPINMLIFLIILAFGFSVFGIKCGSQSFVKILLKAWLVSFVGYVTSIALVYISKYIELYKLNANVMTNPLGNIASAAYIILTLTFTAVIIYLINLKVTLSDKGIGISAKKKHIICALITFISIPYIFLLPKDSADSNNYQLKTAEYINSQRVLKVDQIKNLIINNEDGNKGNKDLVDIFKNSCKYLGTNFNTEKTDILVDKNSLSLIAKVIIDESVVINNLEEYEYWSKYSSIITFVCAKETENIIIYLYDKNGNPVLKNIYNRNDVENQIKSNLTDFSNDPDKLIQIIQIENSKI